MNAPFCLVPVRLSEDELEHVARLAAIKHQSVSDMLREAAGFAPEPDIRAYRPAPPASHHLRLVPAP